MKVEEKLLALNGGDYIAYGEYGDARGMPVFFCHGWPPPRPHAQLKGGGGPRSGRAHHFSRSTRNQPLVISVESQIARLAGGIATARGPSRARTISHTRGFRRRALRLRKCVGHAGTRPRNRGGERCAANCRS